MCLFILSLLVYITSFITIYITFKWFRCGHQQSNPFGYWQSNPWDLHAMTPGNKVRFNIQLTVSSLNTDNAANFSTLAALQQATVSNDNANFNNRTKKIFSPPGIVNPALEMWMQLTKPKGITSMMNKKERATSNSNNCNWYHKMSKLYNRPVNSISRHKSCHSTYQYNCCTRTLNDNKPWYNQKWWWWIHIHLCNSNKAESCRCQYFYQKKAFIILPNI